MTAHRRIALLVGAVAVLLCGWASADPPVRVMRLGYIEGPVSFSPAGEDDWVAATLNRPLVSGDRVWVDAGARAELQAGGVVVRLASGTSVTLLNFDDHVLQLQLPQGALAVRVRRFDANDVIEIDTPNLAYSIRNTGDYRIDVDPAGDATTLVTRRGLAEAYGENAGYRIDAGTAYRFYGTGLVDYERLAVPPPDALDLWAAERDRYWDQSVSARYVSPEVVGYQDLDAYGAWRTVPGYGNVWVPGSVPPGWAPYQDGHWAWIAPWGWTWIDAAPWGFAVSHYGRWANVSGAWCWVPAPVAARAVYAPALVAFVGGANFEVAISAGAVPAVGWFPLGPRDVYWPAYPVSRSYFTRVNTSNTVVNVSYVTNIYNTRDTAHIRYANRDVPGAVVAMPRNAFVRAEPVPRGTVHLGRDAYAGATVSPVAAVAPTPASVRGRTAPGHPPPAQTFDRRVIAKTAPPAAPVSFAAQEHLLERSPGRPLDPAQLRTLQPAAPHAAAPVRLATPAAAPRVERAPQRGGAQVTPSTGAMERATPAPSGRAAEVQPGGTPHAMEQRGHPPPAMPAPYAAPAEPRGRPEMRSAQPMAAQPAPHPSVAQPAPHAAPAPANARSEPRNRSYPTPAAQPVAPQSPAAVQPQPHGARAAEPRPAPPPPPPHANGERRAPAQAPQPQAHGGGREQGGKAPAHEKPEPKGDEQKNGGEDLRRH